MGLTAKKTGDGKDFDPIPEGFYHAICYSIHDLGTQFNEKFGKNSHKVLITWELPTERIEIEKDGETKDLPRAISKRYTLSLHEKAILRKDLESWRGRSFTEKELDGFDLKNVLGANCAIQIIHNKKDDKVYANISTIVPKIKEWEKKEAENPLKFFSFEENSSIPAGTPDWVADIIKLSNEWNALIPEEKYESSSDIPPYDDIPF